MASQFVSDVMHCTASYGERGSGYKLSHRYHRIENTTKRSYIHPDNQGSSKEHNNNNNNNNKGLEKVAKVRGTNLQQAQKLHRLGFSYIATSFIYIVTKFKAFYNGFLGDVASEARMQGIEVPMVEPYFSVPVLPN